MQARVRFDASSRCTAGRMAWLGRLLLIVASLWLNTLTASSVAARTNDDKAVSPPGSLLFESSRELKNDAALHDHHAGRAPRHLSAGLVAGNRPLTIINPQTNRITGIAPDFLALIGASLNIAWTPRIYPDADALRAAVLSNAVDLAIGLDAPSTALGRDLPEPWPSADTGNPRSALTTQPYFRSQIAIIAPQNRRLPPSLSGERIVYLRSALAQSTLQRLYPDASLRAVETVFDALQQVAIGQADVYVGDPAGLRNFARETLFTRLEVRQKVTGIAAPHMFKLSAAHASLARDIDSVIDRVTPDVRGAIGHRWEDVGASDGRHVKIALSEAEQKWIDQNPVVRVATPSYTVPFAFENSAGRFSGIVASVLDMVSSRTGLAFEPIFSTPVKTMMQKVGAGTADMAALSVYTEVKDNPDFLYTRPFMFTTAAIVTRSSDHVNSDVKSLAGRRVVLVEGLPMSHYLLARGLPGANIQFAAGGIDALERVAAGKADAAILYYATANYFISQYYLSSLHISGTTGPAAIPVQFAVSASSPMLRAIVNRAIGSLSDESIDAITTHWSHFTPVPPSWVPQRIHIRNAAIAVALIVAAFIFWNLRLRLRINGRRRQEALLEQRIAFLRRLIDANPNPTYVRDGNGVLVDCNQALCEAVGLPLADILGKTVEQTPGLDSESRIKLSHAHQAIQAGEEKYFQELTLCLNGRCIEGYHWAVPLSPLTAIPTTGESSSRNGSGMLAGWIDLTQIKLMQQQLRQAKEEAESANRAKTLFMATISHEIRTPMNVIIGVLELLKDEPAKPAREHLRQQAQLAYGSATALMTLLNDILEYSRAEVDQMQLHKTPGSLKAHINEVIDFFDPTASAKGLTLSGQIDPRLPDGLLFDANRLRQVLNNLLSNAIKFTESGSITLSVRRCDPTNDADGGMGSDGANDGTDTAIGTPIGAASRDAVAAVAAENAERRAATATGPGGDVSNEVDIEIDVTDTGPGIPESAQADVFQPFKQVSGKIYSRYGGTGMGLAICQRIIGAMGGTITLRSREGEGTTVTLRLRLPLAPVLRAASSCLQGAASGAPFCVGLRAGACVLVVDDHEANLLLLATQLTQLGLRSETAAHAHDALKMLEGQAFDAVITDCNMPDISGYALAETIHRRWPGRLPVIGYSADASSASRQRCLRSGMEGQLVKPVTLSSLRIHLLSDEPSTSADFDGDDINTEGDLPTVDIVERLLRIANGDRNVASRLIDLFEEGLDHSFPRYEAAVKAGDKAGVRQYAHHNKGPAKMLGLGRFAQACEMLMQCGAARNTADIDAVTAARVTAEPRDTTPHLDFVDELHRVRRQLQTIRALLSQSGGANDNDDDAAR